MSSFSRGSRGLSGKGLYIAIAAWLILVIVGGFCTWYGWFGPGSGSSQQVAEATPTAEAVPPTAAPTAALPTPTTALVLPTVAQAQEVFGYGIAINGTGGGDVDYMMGQVTAASPTAVLALDVWFSDDAL